MSTTQIELLQSVYRKETDKERPGILAATANWPGTDIPLDTAPTAPQ